MAHDKVCGICQPNMCMVEVETKENTDAVEARVTTAEGEIDTLQTAVAGKAASSHSHSAATTSANGFMSSTDKSKLDGIATGANAYTHPTTAGNKHIPAGGSSGQILRWSAAGTAVWGADSNTTYSGKWTYTIAEGSTSLTMYAASYNTIPLFEVPLGSVISGKVTATAVDIETSTSQNSSCKIVYLKNDGTTSNVAFGSSLTIPSNTYKILLSVESTNYANLKVTYKLPTLSSIAKI